jgi:hypothetical protein
MAKVHSRLYYQKQHRKDVFWQIWLPVGVGAIAFMALGIMAAFSLQTGSESAARWGHIAVMWMILPLFVVGFAILALLLGLIFGVSKITQIVPEYSSVLLNFVQRITRTIRNYSNKGINPIIVFRSYKAGLQGLFTAIQYTLLGGYKDRLFLNRIR